MVLAHIINERSRTNDILIAEDVTFDAMLLSFEVLEGLRKSGFYKPSPIQLHGIPLGKCGFDLLLEAKSGTGKTAVFSIICLEKIDLCKGLQAIILTPTREIAAQICDVLKLIGVKLKGLQVVVVMGGLPVQEDINRLKQKVHIIVGSPGRLCHLIKDKHVDPTAVRLLILDEADKLMEKSFQSDIHYIFSAIPNQKQIIMSSATFPESAKPLIKQYAPNAHTVCPDSNCVLLGVEQKITLVKPNRNVVRQTQIKLEELLKILSHKQFKQCLIFCNYQARVSELHKLLIRNKWPAEQLYGQQAQVDRLKALKTLQDYKCRILVSTDLAARGIDASNVDLVVNFETPNEWQTYLHRIGRAGRFGSYGTAITILNEVDELQSFKNIIGAIKYSINISHLWTNEIFQLRAEKNNKIEISNKQIDNENIKSTSQYYNVLWNKLIDVNNDNSEETIEDFTTLCTSFKNQNDGVETFNELLDSFNKEETLENKCEYKYIKIEALNADYENLVNGFENYVNIEEYEKDKSQIISDNKTKSRTFKRNITIDSKTKKYNEFESGTLVNRFNESPMSSESSTEYKYQPKGTIDRHKTNKVNNIHDKNHFRRKCSVNNNMNLKKHTNKHFESQALVHNMNHNSIAPSNHNSFFFNSSEEYRHWYKMLKFRMKQIEMAIFIQEMSKLR